MEEKKHFVITIGRQYGSGGRLVGKKLAEELGVHFYDEEILKMTSEESAIGEKYFRPVSYTHLDVYKRQGVHNETQPDDTEDNTDSETGIKKAGRNYP